MSKRWRMPDWMAPYLPVVLPGWTQEMLESYMNHVGTSNILALELRKQAKVVVTMLTRLHDAGKLA